MLKLPHTTYMQIDLKQFNIDLSHPLTSPIVVKFLESIKITFSEREDKEYIQDSRIPSFCY